MTPSRLLLIVNPHAGRGRAVSVQPAVEAALRTRNVDLRVERTRDLDHADVLAADACDDGRVAVTLGGDGLAGRVAGTVAAKGGLLAPLPGGRGNDFVRCLGGSQDPVAAARALPAAVERRIDLAELGGRPYVGIASFGFDSVVQDIAAAARWVRGSQVYTYAAVRGALRWQPARFSVAVDGAAEREFTGWQVVAANSSCYGGGMRIAPDARLDDGLLDVVTVTRTGRVRYLRTFPKVFQGTHVTDPAFAVERARTLRVDADRPFRVYADGDPLATLPTTITVRPGALRVLALPR